jgi:hypothetical protein
MQKRNINYKITKKGRSVLAGRDLHHSWLSVYPWKPFWTTQICDEVIPQAEMHAEKPGVLFAIFTFSLLFIIIVPLHNIVT